jgi:hypothetical protein
MEDATLTRHRPGPDVARAGLAALRNSLPGAALIGLALATLIGFILYPTYPNYDSYYSLLWGREVLHGVTPSFEAFRSPTEHPLAIAFGAVLSLLGNGGDRVMVFFAFFSFVALAAGLYRLGRAAFTPVVGLIAAALVCTRFDFPFLAARAYIDIPYLAVVVWAAALECERPRRGTSVALLLAAAAMMRPEAWLIAGLYFLWIAWPVSWRRRAWFAALTAVGPLVWVAVDYAVTKQPLFSLHHTSDSADALGRTQGLSQIPSSTVQFLKNLDKVPVFYAGILGIVLAIVLVPRRLVMPGLLLIVGLGTFVLVGIAGLSVIDRYLLVPSLMFMVFAAVALGGWSMLAPGRLRTAWIVGSVLLVGYGVGFTLTRVNFDTFRNELSFRGHAHAALVRLFDDPKVRAELSCGPISTPTHKLVPDTRWVTHRGVDGVFARIDVDAKTARARAIKQQRLTHGLALFTVNRNALLNQSFAATTNDYPSTIVNLPMPGFHFVAANSYYSVYSSC